MLELRGLTKVYNVFPAVDHLTFSIAPSEVIGLLGPNGAGKSTTIKMLAGLLEPTEGSIYYGGKNVLKNLYDFKKKLGYVPEQSEIYPHLSALDYLLMVGRLRNIPEKVLRVRIDELMRLFHLSAEMDQAISSYSKGMVQKVLISAALLHDPEILLLDEPLSGLDVTSSMVMRDLVRKLAAAGTTIIYSSHVLEVVEKICARSIIIHKGKVVADDTVDNLRSLMHQPSLEKVFSQLVVEEDTEAVAQGIVEAIKFGRPEHSS
jgi:ABC-2 type transport system ATP-binding protein